MPTFFSLIDTLKYISHYLKTLKHDPWQEDYFRSKLQNLKWVYIHLCILYIPVLACPSTNHCVVQASHWRNMEMPTIHMTPIENLDKRVAKFLPSDQPPAGNRTISESKVKLGNLKTKSIYRNLETNQVFMPVNHWNGVVKKILLHGQILPNSMCFLYFVETLDPAQHLNSIHIDDDNDCNNLDIHFKRNPNPNKIKNTRHIKGSKK